MRTEPGWGGVGKAALLAVLGAAGLGLALSLAHHWAFPSGTLRYRLSLEVDTPEGARAGSSVMEVSYAVQPRWLPHFGGRIQPKFRGEAVVVDLGRRGVLFALLTGNEPTSDRPYVASPYAMPVREFGLAPSVGDLSEATLAGLSRLTARAEVPPERLPMLVRFRDLSDPLTVERVDAQDLAASFGTGVRIARATIEASAAERWPDTDQIEKWLPWLERYYDTKLDGDQIVKSRATHPLANSLGAGDFKAGRS